MSRCAWFVVLTIVAIVGAGVQLDRHAYVVPTYAKFVPTPFESFSLARTILQESERGSPQRAVIDARKLVLKHPIQAESLTILGVAELRNGNQELGSQALTLSAQRGWREPIAQRAVAMAAAQSGSWDVAADRLFALWKTSSDSPEVHDLSAVLMGYPDIQARFAQRLVAQARWQEDFFRWAWRNLKPEAFVRVVEEASRAGAKFECSQMLANARSLLDRGLISLAEAIWRSQCGAGKAYSRNDVAFVDPNADDVAAENPFSWTFPDAIGMTIKFRNNSSGGGLSFQNTEPLRQLLAKKYMALSPGYHKIWLEVGSFGHQERPILVHFSCKGTNANAVFRPVTSSSLDRPIAINIPADRCPVQLLQLRAAKGWAKGVRVLID